MDSSSSTDNGYGGSRHPQEANRLCARGCGFFGTAENGGLCSKCYSNHVRATALSKSGPATIGNNEHQGIAPPSSGQYRTGCMPREVQIAKLIEALRPVMKPEISGGSNPSVSAPPAVKNRCECCRKKVGLLGFQCRCGGTFCGAHRYAEAHTCRFDFKGAGKIAIEEENPVCKADKIRDRV